ncbi:six-hairpin glycosidase-like protein [Maribacter algarum]|uniref:Six-hairpin glycosidase-like protein n=1 Tax=Maribacter algarum (ex Zhang et al. 2020) TaxID=2578118 RepID=A0A5S3Q093_9FLAO|nr:six-hairpin glycosidase-like protein [Maribacter algarum]TMM59007.1 six-hairpin glycosidase-like protein [Maribacter algarum]
MIKSCRLSIPFVLLFLGWQSIAQDNQWTIVSSTEIERVFDGSTSQAYSDNIEMAGKRVAGIVSYAIDSLGKLAIDRQVFFPQLHPFIKENDPSWYVYRSYLKDTYSDAILPNLFVGDKQFAPGPVQKVVINGMLHFKHLPSTSGIVLKRSFLPSSSERLFLEKLTLINAGQETISFQAKNRALEYKTLGTDGEFITLISSDAPSEFTLEPKGSITFSVRIAAVLNNEKTPSKSAKETYYERKAFLKQMSGSLNLETPNPILNTLFEFSKIRASESIFESKLGLIHSPGGGRYYVGIWANDQAEYVSPFFPYLGYSTGDESAMNMYRAFAKMTNPEYTKLPYAFEVEGLPPPSPLDRGDAAMIAYGASQFALATGDKKVANELWPLISWCLEYSNRQLNKEGVVKSESDEMEGRVETGTANLSTSALYYGALRHATDLGRSIGKSKSTLKRYQRQSKALKKAIENYFGANIEGLETYRYYDGHKTLRHWICMPLVVGINDRKDDTIKALFERLWSGNGVHVEKNNPNPEVSEIFWDRGTLYALRGTLLAGATEVSLNKLEEFSKERLLGARVPYVVEAFPEGSMAHLSAESGLYARVFVEGMFGINPTGLNSFTVMPRLPKGWDKMALRNIKAFRQNFDVEIERNGEMATIRIVDNTNGKTLLETSSNLDMPISYTFK